MDDDATGDDQHDKTALYLIPHFLKRRRAPVLLPGPFTNCNAQISPGWQVIKSEILSLLSLHKHLPNASLQ